MSRPRNKANIILPENLYRKADKRNGKIYYTYKDLRTGVMHGLGTDKESAINDALALNAVIYTSIRSARLAAMTTLKSNSPSFTRVITQHKLLCRKRKLAENTIKNKDTTCKAWEAALGGDTLLENITVRQLVEVLDSYQDRPRMAQAMRSAAIDIWKDAIQEGWANDNLAAKTRAESVEVQRSRLTLDDFNKIYDAALTLKDTWIARAMELAIVTAQRREDISNMEFRCRKESTSWLEEDALCIIQQKTGSKLRIPLDIGILGFTVGGIVKSCRDNIVSNWMIHHQCPRTLSKPGDQVWKDTITKGFARARDLAGIKGTVGKQPPTFHELRSLSIRLYTEKYGAEFAQAIAGHKDPAMTAIYRDVRGAEWQQIKA